MTYVYSYSHNKICQLAVSPLQYVNIIYGHLPFAVPYTDSKARHTAAKSDDQHSNYRWASVTMGNTSNKSKIFIIINLNLDCHQYITLTKSYLQSDGLNFSCDALENDNCEENFRRQVWGHQNLLIF